MPKKHTALVVLLTGSRSPNRQREVRTIPRNENDLLRWGDIVNALYNCRKSTPTNRAFGMAEIRTVLHELEFVESVKPNRGADRRGRTMREILFRGKRIDNGEWVEGYLIHDKHDGLYRIVIKLEYSTGTYIVTGFAPRVNVETVGQYTGLTDKNGKKVFEGDVIECWSEGVKARGTVQQNRGGLWIIYPAWQKRIMWGLCPNEDGSTDVEIIGNIHDNPELLKGAD